MKRIIIIAILALSSSFLYSQVSGERFLLGANLPASARASGIGNQVVSTNHHELGFLNMNPSLWHKDLNGQILLYHSFLPGQTAHSAISYGYQREKWQLPIFASFRYQNYGTFTERNAENTVIGKFKASEAFFQVGTAYSLEDKLNFGLNVRFGFTNYGRYKSQSITSDLGISYQLDEARKLGLAIRQIGVQLSPLDIKRETIKPEIHLGYSQRLQYIPFVFMIQLNHLEKWELEFDDILNRDLGFINQEPEPFKRNALQNALLHLGLGGEFFLGKNENFWVRFGYDHLQNQSLKIRNLRGFGGISLGVGFQVRAYTIDYTYSSIQFGVRSHQLGIKSKLSYFLKDRSI